MRTHQGLYSTNAHSFRTEYFQLILAIMVSAFIVGCAAQPLFGPAPLSNIEGKWFWKQDPWHGYFVLNKKGNSYAGTLDDIFEGTYGDLITDVEISNNNIKFTRDGRFSIQHWEGTLKVEDGLLKIVDGRWTKGPRIAGSFYAEKRD